MAAHPWLRPASLTLLLVIATASLGDDKPKTPPRAFTFDEALEQLALHSKDPYLQYVAMQLGKREGRERQVFELIDRLSPPQRVDDLGRNSRTDLFSTFTGALAIQEGLQLDTMRGQRPGRPRGEAPLPPGAPVPPPKKAEKVPIAKIEGPTVKSHPWEKMLGDKKPDVGPLAVCVPEDFWFAEFRTLSKVREITSLSELWGGHLFTMVLGEARSQATAQRIKSQLGLANVAPAVLDAIQVDNIALTGSDLFLSEGSDVTLLVQGRQVAALQRLIDSLRVTEKAEPGEHAGIQYSHRRSADGSLNVFIANPRPELHIRSNSLPALKRVLECVVGRAKNRLGDSTEFKYIRTLMPRGAAEEDGFVYLSDPFIRYMVGPQLKLTERRRVLVYNHLRMIGHACLLFRTEHGRAPKSLEELTETKCAPGVFGKGELAHPDGGTYSIAEDGMAGICSKYGRADAMSPCLEHLVTEVNGDEAAEYRQFLPGYEQYWQTYFDPIAVRVQVAAKQYRLETLVLPLLDNSVYTTMAALLGGKPAALNALPVPRREIGGLWLHFEKKHLLEALGPERLPEAEPKRPKLVAKAEYDLKQFGLALHNYLDVNGRLPGTAIQSKDGKPLLSWRVALLPFLEQDNLYRQFKLDEPWDSAHNKKLIEMIPAVYAAGNAKLAAAGMTNYVAPVGKDTIFPPDSAKLRFADISDGLSNTIIVVEANDDNAAVWTKPDDLPFDPKKPLAGLERSGQPYFLALMADGSVERISTKIEGELLRRAFVRNDGQPLQLSGRGGKQRPRLKNVVNDLKEIAIAMHHYDSANGKLPAAATMKDSKSLLSWRVALLPYIGEDALYREFDPNEPWDSERNKKLIEKMPRLYQGPNGQLNGQGKTTYVVPIGKAGKYETIFDAAGTRRTFAHLTAADGTANTILAVVADEDHAVVWTKPDDWPFDPEKPTAGLAKVQKQIIVAMADGTVQAYSAAAEPTQLASAFGWRDGEPAEPGRPVRGTPGQAPPADDVIREFIDEIVLQGLEAAGMDLNKLRRFVRDGIGDEIGVQVHDSSDMLDFSSGGLFRGPDMGIFGIGVISPFLPFATSPMTISLPVKDAKAVDEFLAEIDNLMVKLRSSNEFGFLRDLVEYYKAPLGGQTVRVIAITFSGLKARLYLARIGDGLYLANRPTLIDDLAAAHAEGRRAKPSTGHALVRVRPENWRDVLPTHNLGWAEGHRKACVENLSLVANVTRGWDTREANAELLGRVERVYGTRPYCPDGGAYTLANDGKSCACSLHGTARDPRQPKAPADSSATAKSMRAFAGLSATLTFEQDRLRAIVVVERKE